MTASVAAADTFEPAVRCASASATGRRRSYLTTAQASATLPAGLDIGAQTVTAEYLGFDILLPSQADASFEVLPDVGASVAVAGRCVAGKVVLTVVTTNDDDRSIAVDVETPYGAKQIASIAPGKSVASAFSTRLTSVPSGTVTATATADAESGPVESEYTVDQPAVSCTR